jgi:hypothetical protein
VTGSGRRAGLAGMDAFASQFKVHKKLLVGGQGIRLDEFLASEADAWF